MNNAILVNTGMKILIEKLGNVEAEKFISLLLKEPFDYTKWQRDLFQDMTIEEISAKAMESLNRTYKKDSGCQATPDNRTIVCYKKYRKY